MTFDKNEIDLLLEMLRSKLDKTNKEIAVMADTSEHFFVNEGLLNEVRYELEKLLLVKNNILSIIKKLEKK